MTIDLRGRAPESWCCIDCGYDTAPGHPTRAELENAMTASVLSTSKNLATLQFSERTEVYHVREKVWQRAGMGPWSGCLCIGCLEKRIKRRLTPDDFPPKHPFNRLPGTPRLKDRRDRPMRPIVITLWREQ
jgi:hypothetical protein